MGITKVKQSGTTVVVGNNDEVIVDISGGGDVTIQANPNSSANKIEVRFGGDTESDKAVIDLSTFSQNGLQIDVKQYDLTDILKLEGGSDFQVNPNDHSQFQFKYIDADGNTYTGFVQLKDGGEKDFTTVPPPLVVCFVNGSLIEVEDGYCAVEDLKIGDLVRTQSGDLVPIRWIGSRALDTVELLQNPQLQPITILENANG